MNATSHSIVYICFIKFFMVTICQDICKICMTFFVYEVRKKSIIYSKTCCFSLFTISLGIKVRVTNIVFVIVFFFLFLPKCPIIFKNSRLVVLCIPFSNLTGFWCYEWEHKNLIQLHCISSNKAKKKSKTFRAFLVSK